MHVVQENNYKLQWHIVWNVVWIDCLVYGSSTESEESSNVDFRDKRSRLCNDLYPVNKRNICTTCRNAHTLCDTCNNNGTNNKPKPKRTITIFNLPQTAFKQRQFFIKKETQFPPRYEPRLLRPL